MAPAKRCRDRWHRVQGHFDEDVEPLVVKARLDNLATLGIPIWVTEYDSKTPDVNKRAENLENLYRIAFSHPRWKVL